MARRPGTVRALADIALPGDTFASAQTSGVHGCSNDRATTNPLKETQMYIGGGILGTLLLIALIIYVVRRI